MARISVQTADFDIGAEFGALTGGRSDIGGIGCFVGTVRSNAQDRVAAMTLEHYPAMTERAIAAHHGGSRTALEPAWLHGDPPRWPADRRREHRAGAGRRSAPPAGAGCHRVPDRLAEDKSTVLEEGGVRGRWGKLGRGACNGRRGRGAVVGCALTHVALPKRAASPVQSARIPTRTGVTASRCRGRRTRSPVIPMALRSLSARHSALHGRSNCAGRYGRRRPPDRPAAAACRRHSRCAVP